MANDQFPGGSRRLWWLAAIAYGLANILLHEPANDIAKRLVVVLGLQLFLWSTRAFFLAGAVLVLFLCRHLLRDSQTVRRLLIFIPFAAALDLSLVIYPSERIHYPQYAILAWMAFKAGGQALPAVLLSFIFGYLDEANQHWVLYANDPIDRKSTRLNSSHLVISYAVFCLKKKKHGKLTSAAHRMSERLRRLLVT